ncbi:hypothetical protein [Paracoccus chinensis]|uniref:Uncharacterized protein n=1 Tax=Paracoccus chinensis TaxID=525640 RepID=A0A1G9GRL1_9RHOB|nr:hypothetical protein [Paracoccus chinensis]SDL03297.1 hypothetical protein SAMN04487971_105183 [Paracoccus chinensis]
MPVRATFSRFCRLAALAVLPAACGGADDAYPRLVPLSELNAPPAIPAHAAEAAADPEAVGEALRARRAEAAARAAAAQGTPADTAALTRRAAALRDRAEELSRRDPGAAGVSVSAAPSQSAPDTDPETAARARALRERARRMLDGDAAPADLPPCPPGTADPTAAGCLPR